jgi:hypothetical protein
MVFGYADPRGIVWTEDTLSQYRKPNSIFLVVLALLSILPFVTVGGGTSTFPISFKATGGCAFSCFRSLRTGNSYCSGITTTGLTTTGASPSIIVEASITTTDANVTGEIVEVQVDLTTDLNNNVYMGLGLCGTTGTEFGSAQYYPVINQGFTTTMTIVFPFQGNSLITGTTYFGSVSIRPFFGGDVSLRVNTPTTNGIVMQEVK